MSAIFSWVDSVKATGVLTAASQASTLPVQNLADRKVQKVWRSLLTTTWFGVDFGANVPISVLALFGCTLAASDTVRHRLSTTALGNGGVLDTGAVACNVQPRYNQHLYLTNTVLSARYWQCDIVATSRVALGTVDIGRAWAGDIWTPSIAFDYGWGEVWQDDAQVSKSPRSGVVCVSDGALYRRLTAIFANMTDADKAQAMEMDAAIGSRGQLLFIPDSANLNTTPILGRSTGSGGGSSVAPAIITAAPITNPTDSFPARYSKTYSIEQDL